MPHTSHLTPSIGSAEFAKAMEQFAPYEAGPRIAVAVSGGPDSMALLLLCHEWAKSHGGAAIGLTVDHGLRPESMAEAVQVRNWSLALGIEHHILSWQGEKPASGLMDAARRARRALLEEWCAANEILHLALGHHADDQAETVLMRFAKGSGIDGLSGMKAEVFRPQLRILRPFLSFEKKRLTATCDARRQSYVQDPSNSNLRFARARFREMEMLLSGEGFSHARLNDMAQRARSAADELDHQTRRGLALSCAFDPVTRQVVLTPQALNNTSFEIRSRVLRHVLMNVGSNDYPPRRVKLDVLVDQIWSADGLKRRRTLHDCLIAPRKGMIEFKAERVQ